MKARGPDQSSATSPRTESAIPTATQVANGVVGLRTTVKSNAVASGLAIACNQPTPRSAPTMASVPDTASATSGSSTVYILDPLRRPRGQIARRAQRNPGASWPLRATYSR